MPDADIQWGEDIAVEMVGGIPYRMIAARPRRIEALLAYAAPWGERVHLIQDERSLGFAAFHAAVLAQSARLTRHGARAGDRIFLIGWNSPEWVINFWACLHAGAIPVLANAWWSAAEIAQGMALIQPALTLADAAVAARLPQGTKCAPWSAQDADLAAAATPDSAGTTPPADPAARSEEDTALIIFTSGTSGQPKAVVLSHRAVLARLHMTLAVTKKLPHQTDRNPATAPTDVTLLTGPLFHVGGMQGLLRAVMTGDTLVLSSGRYDPGAVLALIERHKVRRWNAVPTMVSRLLDHPDLARRDLSSLKSISIGGAPVTPELMRRIRTSLPMVSPRIPTGYGLTENGGQATAAAGSEDIAQLGSTGRPLACVEVKFLEHPGLPEGEILLRSPTQMSGYFGLAESPIDAEGWLHTGDLGRLDERGQLWITGRSKDMIIRGGENIAPAAVERALCDLPGVAEAAVIGVPHPDLGEEVMAVVVIDSEPAPDAAALQAQLKGKLASFAVSISGLPA